MKIILKTLGQEPKPDTIEVSVELFSKHQLEYNLKYLWAWFGVIDSDGPCVAVKFN